MPKSTVENDAADASSDSSTVKLKVWGHLDGQTITFKVRRHIPIKKLLLKFCEEKYYDFKTVRFLINGSRFPHSRTPEQLGLDDGDQIDAMVEVSGGGHVYCYSQA